MKQGRTALLGVLSALAIGVVLILPIAAASTFTAPYANANYTLYPFTTGASAVNTHGLFGPLTGTGKTVFWHNSTVGQVGPAKAEFGALQGFGTSATIITAGSHTVTATWSWTGEGVIGINCFGGGGTGQAVITEKVEVNLLNVGTGKWLLTNNVVSQIWTHSITVCGTWSFYTLGGSSAVPFSGITIPGTAAYQIWSFVYTNTTAIESSASDVQASACIDYALNTTSCYGNQLSTGVATLTSIALT